MMLNNPNIKYYYIVWPSCIDYALDFHWWYHRKLFEQFMKGTKRRFAIVCLIVIIVIVPFLNIVVLLIQSLFMSVYIASFITYLINVCNCCHKEDPWASMIYSKAIEDMGYSNYYIVVDYEKKLTNVQFITYRDCTDSIECYREKNKQTSGSFEVMLYCDDFKYMYNWIMLIGFTFVAVLYALTVAGVVIMTRIVSEVRS